MRNLANAVQSQGRGNDTMLVHMTPKEVGGLQALAMANGGSLTINPQTGLPEAGFLESILPMVAGLALGPAGLGMSALGAGLTVGGLTGLATGDITKGLMAGLGAYGGSNLGSTLSGAGAASQQAQAAELIKSGAADPTQLVQATQTLNPALTSQQAYDMVGGGQGLAQAMRGVTPEMAAQFNMTVPQYQQAMGGAFANTVAATPTNQLIAQGIAQPSSQLAMQGAQSAFQPGGLSNLAEAGKQVFNQQGTMGKIATVTGLGAPLVEAMQPAPLTLPTTEEASSYAGPYTPTRRAVTYPGLDRTSTSEFSYFSPSNPVPYARGGDVNMEDGGFVVDARTVSEIGNGSSNAGLERLARLGARPIQGRGDGVSDSIPANIGGSQEARVARDEAYLPPEAVKRAGGATKLYAMMDKAHKARKSAKRGQDTGGLRALMA